MLDDYTRAHVNRAIEDALRPRGMSIHNGKTSIDAATLQRLVTMIDRGTEARMEALDRIAVLEQDVERLRAELAEVSKDAARYRWLRGDSCMDHSVRWTQWEVRRWNAPIWTNDLRRADLDAAIDDAMRKEPDHAR